MTKEDPPMPADSCEPSPFLTAPSWVFQELRRARIARLATASSEAEPLAVPLCFVFEGRCVYSAIDQKPKPRASSARDLGRLIHLRANPKAILLLDEWHEDWSRLWWIQVRGSVRLLEGGDEFEGALRSLTSKYPQYQERPPLGEKDGGTVIALDVERLRSWRGSAIGDS